MRIHRVSVVSDALLHRMRRAVIAVGHPLLLHAVRQHAGVFARTVVVDAARRLAGARPCASAVGSCIGRCGPHASAASVTLAFARIERAAAT